MATAELASYADADSKAALTDGNVYVIHAKAVMASTYLKFFPNNEVSFFICNAMNAHGRMIIGAHVF